MNSTQLIQSGGIQQVATQSQVIYLDFDGELTSYNGELLTVDEVTVEDSRLSQERIAEITAALNEKFAGQNVCFVSDLSDLSDQSDYSTIYIGKTSAFEQYGHFAGLAETVDSGNQNKNDKAFVMLDSTSDNAQIIETIAHEAGHLVGTLDHGGDGLAAYAYQYDVSSGVTSTGVLLNFDSMYVYYSGTANSTTVNSQHRYYVSRGYMYISSGGTANFTTLNPWGSMHVSSGGTANSTTINAAGSMIVSDGGTANFTTVNSNGCMYVSRGGSANFANVDYGGMLLVDGTANSTTVNYSGYMHVYSGGTANNINGIGCNMWIGDGGKANHIDLSGESFYVQGYKMAIDDGGMADSITVNKYGSMVVSSGGTALNIIENGGCVMVDSDAEVSFIANCLNGLVVSNGSVTVHSGTTANSSLLSGGSMGVFSGGTANFTKVNLYGSMYVYSGGTANSTTVNERGSMYVFSGGMASATTVNAGMYVFSGGTASATIINSGGWMMGYYGMVNSTIVRSGGGLAMSSGGTASGTVVSGGSLRITEGGTGNSTTIYSGGRTLVFGTANRTAVNSGGSLIVDITGSAANTTVSSGGSMVVSSGGTASGTIVSSGGNIDVSAGANLSSVTLNQGAVINRFSFARNLSLTEIKNGEISVSPQVSIIDNSMSVSSGGTVNGADIHNNGRMYVSGGGTANRTAVQSGAQMAVLCSGRADNTAVSSGGSMAVSSGGTASGTVISSGGRLAVLRGGTASGTVVSGGSMAVLNGGTASGTVVSSGGSMAVSSGGIVSGTIVSSGGIFAINRGGSASVLTLSKGGVINRFSFAEELYYGQIKDGAVEIAPHVSIMEDVMTVSGGGTANNTVIYGSGSMYVLSGGRASKTTVSGKDALFGNMYISSGGTAAETTVGSNGSMSIAEGGTALNIKENGGAVFFSDKAKVTFLANTFSDVEIANGGSATVHSGTTAVRTSVRNGTLFIEGGKANRTVVNTAGILLVSGGTANGTVIHAGGSMTVQSGAAASCTDIYSGGSITVQSGAAANGTDIHSGGSMTVLDGSIASRTNINAGGSMIFTTGCMVTDTAVNSGGSMTVSSGCTAAATMVNDCGNLFVSSGGTATVQYNPWMGQVFAENGASVTYLDRDAGVYYQDQNLKTGKGNTVSNVILAEHQSAIVFSGGSAANLAVENGGTLDVCKGGIVNGFTATEDQTMTDRIQLKNVTVSGRADLSNDDTANAIQIFQAGTMFLHDKAQACNLSVAGAALVGFGCTAENVTVSANGGVYVMGGGEVKGTISVAETGGLYLYGGSIVNGEIHVRGTLYVDETMVNNGHITVALNSSASIENLDYMSGTDNFSVETGGAKAGFYTLASGAADYRGTVTVEDNGTELGTLNVGETRIIGDTSYTLTQKDGMLGMALEAVVVKSTRGDFGGEIGVSDILFQNLTDPANPLGAWMDADKMKWVGDLGPAAKSDWTVYGAYDFTGDGICDIMFRSKLESTQYAVGYYDMGHDREFKTMGWGVTAEWELTDVGDFNGNGIADILWKNSTNGYLGLWMDGTDQWVALPASALSAGQSIIGMGDVNNDGCDDILINSNGVLGAWDITGILDGTEGTPVWSSFGITVSSDWATIGCADFDGNGKADIVLWNDNGYIGTYMNCDGNDFRGIYPSAAKTEWGIPGFGDYDGDGSEDVLVRNLASGALGYWDGNDDFKWHEIGCGVDSTWAVIA